MNIPTTQLKGIIDNSLKEALSYEDYRALVKALTDQNLSTGDTQSEALSNYTMLNNKRMKRWDKTVKISEDKQEAIKKAKVNETWLVLTESWCGDAAHLMPVMNKVADLNKGIDFKVVLRDDNDDLMNQFLTNGGKSIPMLIMLDNNTGEVKNTFGPRPSEATQLVNDYKAQHGKLTPEFKADLQAWYNKNKGQNAVEDLLTLLES